MVRAYGTPFIAHQSSVDSNPRLQYEASLRLYDVPAFSFLASQFPLLIHRYSVAILVALAEA